MSFQFPRRVRDLPKLEDSEDDFTPLKQQTKAELINNKENDPDNTRGGSTKSFNSTRMV